MCGIAGILDLGGAEVDAADVGRMIAAIRYRGPDDHGVVADRGVALGSARLAIIDLSPAGHQPMASDDQGLLLAYNGELYNFRTLAAELEGHGHRFRSRSDTEVVLRAYQEWGPACVERFDGMFAFAVWDAAGRSLFLARDRFGIKPLYYAHVGNRLLFASEVKALLAAGLQARVSEEALAEYFTFQNIYSDLTLFHGVHMLAPGSTLSVQIGGAPRTRRYWDLEIDPDESVSEREWIERIKSAFEAAVDRQLVADVPLGSYLSGGMDSASIAAVASRSIPRLMTFTGGFDLSSVTGLELVFDERADAEYAANSFSTEHYEMVMHAGDMAWVLPELVWHLEDLRIGMCYQNHYIARLASKFVTVVLAGTGGDELFAGYPWRYQLVEHAKHRNEFDDVYYKYWTRLVPDHEKSDFFAEQVWSRVRDRSTREIFVDVASGAGDVDPVSRALYFEAKTFLHGLLVVEDKVSMAHSLEARVPFLDNELVDVARRIPARLKHSGASGKPLLRRAMAEFLPPGLLEKKKQGFSPPDRSWYAGPTMSYIQRVLLDRRSLDRGWFKEEYVRRVLSEHLSGRVNHRLLIWSLLSFEWWNRLFIDGEPGYRHGEWHHAIPAASSVALADVGTHFSA